MQNLQLDQANIICQYSTINLSADEEEDDDDDDDGLIVASQISGG